jgi:hypothetical protein
MFGVLGTAAIATVAFGGGVISAIAAAFVGMIVTVARRRRRVVHRVTIGRMVHAEKESRNSELDIADGFADASPEKSPNSCTCVAGVSSAPAEAISTLPPTVAEPYARIRVLDPDGLIAQHCVSVCAHTGRTVVLAAAHVPLLMHDDRGRC